ncbi:unnamed protein product [marine sediment metagenome]|uniref:Uncharacterized protein n=1 Tax=marine sediment metagenome TaxID=412755 RepID=X1PW68_9ZZZZ
MPEFNLGSSHTAIVPMSNPTSKAFDYEVELYMGTDLALMARASFHLEAGESKDISMPVIMPSVIGAYPVNIAVFSGGEFIPPVYKGDDITIISAVPKTTITGASWKLIDYPFVGYWPEETGPLTAVFCKGELQVNSDIEFVGSAVITCPNTIAPIPLLTAYGYQVVLDEIDADIAEHTGAIKELWQDRRAIFVNYPKVDGFTIDYRWWDVNFRDWIYSAPVETFILNNVLIPKGTSTVKVGFFAKYGTAVGLHPAVVSLYSDGNILASIESNLVPPGTVPQLLGVTLPTSVASGGDISSTTVLRLPPQSNKDYFFELVSFYGEEGEVTIAKASYAPAAMVNTWSSRGCNPIFQPLNAPDDIYTIAGIWDRSTRVWVPGKASYYDRHNDTYIPLPSGAYPVSLRGKSWRIGVPPTGCGIYYYGLGPVAEYNFGVVGYLVVT